MKRTLDFIIDGAWLWAMLLCIIVMLTGCFGGRQLLPEISLKDPVPQMVIQDLAQTAGYFIGKDKPELAKEMIDHDSKADKEDVLAYWPSWQNYILYRLENRVEDDFLKMKVDNLFKNIDLEFQVKTEPSEQIEIIKSVLEAFKSGLEVGIKAKE